MARWARMRMAALVCLAMAIPFLLTSCSTAGFDNASQTMSTEVAESSSAQSLQSSSAHRSSTEEYRYIAHQGKVGADGEKGNTLEAFERAAQVGEIYGIETDVWRTGDGEFVCIHGGDETAKWAGMDISSSTLAELTEWSKNGHDLPTLADYLEICREGDKVPFVEIKDPDIAADEAYCEDLIDALAANGMLSGTVITAHISRAEAAGYMKSYAASRYGVDILAFTGSGDTNERVDEAIKLAEEYELDGIGASKNEQLAYASDLLKDTSLKLRRNGAMKNEEDARAMVDRYGLWCIYTEFTPQIRNEEQQKAA